jgi:hypothetical protein
VHQGREPLRVIADVPVNTDRRVSRSFGDSDVLALRPQPLWLEADFRAKLRSASPSRRSQDGFQLLPPGCHDLRE